jgi:hypothetical protein
MAKVEMKYVLAKVTAGSRGFVEISKEEYSQVKSAKANLLEALFIEEKFNIVIDNYLELETDLLACAARYMIRPYGDYTWSRNERNLVNRRFANLLTACRSYLDQTPHHLHNIFGKQLDAVAEFKRHTSSQYDKYLGYRVMEALRNHVQHRAFPVYITWDTGLVESKSGGNFWFSLKLRVLIADLEENKKFKKSVLDELKKKYSDEFDVKPFIRDYIESLGHIHEEIRERLKVDVHGWEQTILGSMNQFQEKYPQESSSVGLAAIMKDDDETYHETERLSKNPIKYRQRLETQNRTLVNLAKRYVTGEVVDPDT